jgi:predicted nucleic acid-binding Zn ribbon protein
MVYMKNHIHHLKCCVCGKLYPKPKKYSKFCSDECRKERKKMQTKRSRECWSTQLSHYRGVTHQGLKNRSTEQLAACHDRAIEKLMVIEQLLTERGVEINVEWKEDGENGRISKVPKDKDGDKGIEAGSTESGST